MDTIAMFRKNIGLCMGTTLWALLESLCRTHVLFGLPRIWSAGHMLLLVYDASEFRSWVPRLVGGGPPLWGLWQLDQRHRDGGATCESSGWPPRKGEPYRPALSAFA